MAEHRFDELAKALARGVSRREALRRLGGGLAGAALASLGLGKAWGDPGGNSECAHWCDGIYPPGPLRGKCKSDAAQGAGLCYQCGPAAPAGSTEGLCSSATLNYCADLQSDASNCGACGHACGSNQVCISGTCFNTCTTVGFVGACYCQATVEGQKVLRSAAYCYNPCHSNSECGSGSACFSGCCAAPC